MEMYNDINLNKIKSYLGLNNYNLINVINVEQVKELCVAKLCAVLGVNCAHNCNNDLFEIFSCIMGEAVCELLHIHVHIAKEDLRLVRYSGINFIKKSYQILEMKEIDEAVLDIFIFIERNKNLLGL